MKNVNMCVFVCVLIAFFQNIFQHHFSLFFFFFNLSTSTPAANARIGASDLFGYYNFFF